jgi:alkaline phosphatase
MDTDEITDQMMYEIDRQQNPAQEPSLLEMVETALNSLDRATKWGFKGYFLMIGKSSLSLHTVTSNKYKKQAASTTPATQTTP